jgi:hypothetical protein
MIIQGQRKYKRAYKIKRKAKGKKKELFLTAEQKRHYESCPYVETCEFCNGVTKKLNRGYEIK